MTLGAAKLADSSTLLGLKAPVMCTNGYYPVYSMTTGAGLYGKANALFGWLQFTNIDNLVQSPSGSSLVWLVSPNTIVGQSYNAGFTNVARSSARRSRPWPPLPTLMVGPSSAT